MSVFHTIVVLFETAVDTDRQWSVPVARTARGEEKTDRCLVVGAVTGAAFLCTTYRLIHRYSFQPSPKGRKRNLLVFRAM